MPDILPEKIKSALVKSCEVLAKENGTFPRGWDHNECTNASREAFEVETVTPSHMCRPDYSVTFEVHNISEISESMLTQTCEVFLFLELKIMESVAVGNMNPTARHLDIPHRDFRFRDGSASTLHGIHGGWGIPVYEVPLAAVDHRFETTDCTAEQEGSQHECQGRFREYRVTWFPTTRQSS